MSAHSSCSFCTWRRARLAHLRIQKQLPPLLPPCRYYFGNLRLTLNQVRLSVIKSSKLSPDLQAVKRKLGLGLITFEDANIELEPFAREEF